MEELTIEELMLCEGGTVAGDLLIVGGTALIGLAVGGIPGVIVGAGIGVLGVMSNY